jgi:hypothetical protein
MSRSVTSKGMDRFVETVHDRRFSPYLFASFLANEDREIQSAFFDVMVSYLHILATQSALGIDYFGTQELANQAYGMYQGYLNGGGTGTIPNSIDLNIFDS